jgi:HEAT repeat protein
VKRRLIILAAAALAAGCGGPAAQNPQQPPEAMAGVRFDPYVALSEALRSGQAPLESLAAETFLEADRPPPRGEIEPLAENADPRVRLPAIALLATTRRPDMVPLFQRKLRDGDPNVRLAAALGLALAGDASQATALKDGLSSPDVTVRRTAAWLLGLMGQPSAVGMLKVKLDDPDAVVVLRVAEALWRLGSRDGLDAVRTLTEHDRHQVRYWATRLLGRIGTAADVPRLEKLCQSRFLDVKFAAIAAAAEQGDLKRIGLLLDMLEAPEADSRVLAARELGETAYTPALDRLEQMMARGDPLERTTAAASVVRILSARSSWRSRIMEDRPPPPVQAPRP